MCREVQLRAAAGRAATSVPAAGAGAPSSVQFHKLSMALSGGPDGFVQASSLGLEIDVSNSESVKDTYGRAGECLDTLDLLGDLRISDTLGETSNTLSYYFHFVF